VYTTAGKVEFLDAKLNRVLQMREKLIESHHSKGCDSPMFHRMVALANDLFAKITPARKEVARCTRLDSGPLLYKGFRPVSPRVLIRD
jgi:hypothetical protein